MHPNDQFEKTQPDIRANGDNNRPGTNPNDPGTWGPPNKEGKQKHQDDREEKEKHASQGDRPKGGERH